MTRADKPAIFMPVDGTPQMWTVRREENNFILLQRGDNLPMKGDPFGQIHWQNLLPGFTEVAGAGFTDIVKQFHGVGRNKQGCNLQEIFSAKQSRCRFKNHFISAPNSGDISSEVLERCSDSQFFHNKTVTVYSRNRLISYTDHPFLL